MLSRLILVGFIVFMPFTIAQSYVSPAHKLLSGEYELSLGIDFSDIEYESKSNTKADIDRKSLGMFAAYGLTPYTDLFGQLGMILEADLDGSDDQGFMFGGGVRGLVFKNEHIKVFALGELTYIIEDYSSNVSGTHLALDTQAVVSWSPDERFELYGGFIVTPFSDSQIKTSGIKVDGKKDEFMTLRVGTYIKMSGFYIRPDIKIMGDQSFSLSFGAFFD